MKSASHRWDLANFGWHGHDFYTSGAAAAATDTFCILEAWGAEVAVTYDLYLPESNSSVSRTATIALGQRIYGRISNLEVTDGGTVLAYNYPE